MRCVTTCPHAAIYGESGRRLVFYLSMEEYAAKILTEHDEIFFIWQVPPTVIFGRNQVMEAEVNMQYCQEQGVNLFRRKSGGGCVYSDSGNIMFSYITNDTDVEKTFEKYLEMLEGMLRDVGVEAYRSGRNDIMIDGRKVSGNAFYKMPGRSVVHGTLLFNSDFDALQRAITPSAAKIGSKGVASVRSHVANIKSFLQDGEFSDINKFKKHIIEYFSQGEEPLYLDEKDIAGIEEIEKTYLEPAFLKGHKHEFDVSYSKKIEGVGEFVLKLSLDGKIIKDVNLSGDYFSIKPLDKDLSACLVGLEKDITSIEKALKDIDLSEYILGFSNQMFLNILL